MARKRIISPNFKLQEERLRRSWSQLVLADRLGTTHNNVSRWERGVTRPGPYFRQKLREVFCLTEAQLGLKADEVREAQVAPAHTPRRSQCILDPLIPSALAHGLVGRDELLKDLKKHLFSPPSLAISAINGMPGAGKTALAVALAHDQEVREHFHDGVLWAGLGPRPDLLAQLSRWGTVLGMSGEKLTTLEEWAVALRMTIGSRHMLVLIDDVWQLEQALTFKVGGSNCTYLLTTRFADIAVQFATGAATTVCELNELASVTLLKRLVPGVVASDPQALQELVGAVGGLPLALTLMGKYLRTQAYSGQPRRLHNAIEKLRDTEVRLALSEPQSLLERTPTLSREVPVSLQTVIAVSDQRLNEQAHSALRALSVFPAKPNGFSEQAALAVCALDVEVLDQLHDFGLLESNGPGRYTLHQTIADYARLHRDNTKCVVEERFASYVAGFVQARKTEYLAIEVESVNIIAALDVAFAHKLLASYVQIILGFAHYLAVRGMYSTAEYHLQRALHGEGLDAASHAEILSYLGIIAKKHGRLHEAEAYHQQGLILARQGSTLKLEVEHLTRLGFLYSLRQQYSQARATFQAALDKAQHLNDTMELCTILNGLAVVLKETASYAAAKRYLWEGLVLARKHGLVEREVTLLINLSTIESLQRNTAEAEHLAQQALAMAQAHGLNESLTYLYNLLSDLAMDRDDYQQARVYSTSCLSLARQLGHVELIGASLCTLGTALGRLDDFNRAQAVFQEAFRLLPAEAFPLLLQEVKLRYGEICLLAGRVEQAQEIFHALTGVEEADIRASALSGLARVFALRKDAEGAGC